LVLSCCRRAPPLRASCPVSIRATKGNDKPAALTQVTAHKGDPESGKPVTVLVFTTKDQAGDPKAAFNALFGKFGDALVAKVSPRAR
jgi:hypothetical protein